MGLYARYKNYLSSCDNQFGFKKGLSCSHAIYSVRRYVDRFVNEGSTVNICGIDLSKAFDKVNIFALFTKLMERNLPREVLCVIEQWLQNSWTCVKWCSAMSDFLKIDYESGRVPSCRHIYFQSTLMELLILLNQDKAI